MYAQGACAAFRQGGGSIGKIEKYMGKSPENFKNLQLKGGGGQDPSDTPPPPVRAPVHWSREI